MLLPLYIDSDRAILRAELSRPLQSMYQYILIMHSNNEQYFKQTYTKLNHV